jgi:Domain of unknown function (DUF4157)
MFSQQQRKNASSEQKDSSRQRTSTPQSRSKAGLHAGLPLYLGNQPVLRLGQEQLAPTSSKIHFKLMVNQPGDSHEQEADRLAGQVMRMSEPQCVCASGGSCPKCPVEQPGREHGRLQTRRAESSALGQNSAPPIVHEVLASPGQPLDLATRSFMEPRLGRDFSRVRVHTDAKAAESVQAMNALAYTVGRDVVFGSAQYAPGTMTGRALIAHELTHVVQQSGTAAVVQRAPTRQPAPPDPRAERAAAVAEAEVVAGGTYEQLEAQVEAEVALRLDGRRRKDKSYAWSLGQKDKARIQKSGKLTSKQLQEVTVKIRFFDDEAKGAYIQTISPALQQFAETEQVIEVLAVPAAASAGSARTCDVGQKQILLQYEGAPERNRCIDRVSDPELNNLADRNIVNAVGYSVASTTWENVKYERFNVMLVNYKNGTSEYFMLNDVGDFHYSPQLAAQTDYTYLKRENGLIYPFSNGRIYYHPSLTPNLISQKNGLKYQIKQLQELYTLLQTTGAFASIMGMYGIPQGFKASLQGLKRPQRVPAGTTERAPQRGAAPKTPTIAEEVDQAFRTLPEADPHSRATKDSKSQIRSGVMIGGEPQPQGQGKGGIPASKDPKAGPPEVLDVGAGTKRPNLGLPPERQIVAVTHSDVSKTAQPDVILDATQPIPKNLQSRFTTLIINNPYGYTANIGELKQALGPNGKIIVQGNWEANKYFRALGTSPLPPNMTRTIERNLPPSAVLGEGFRTSSGDKPVQPNARITFEVTNPQRTFEPAVH